MDPELLDVVDNSDRRRNTGDSTLQKNGGGRWGALGVVILLLAGLYGVTKLRSDGEEAASAEPLGTEESEIVQGPDGVSTNSESPGFGNDVGWDIFQTGGDMVSRLSLEDGARTAYEGRLSFVAAVGERVLVMNDREHTLGLLEFGLGSFEIRTLDSLRNTEDSYGPPGVFVDDSSVWLLTFANDGPATWELWDLSLDVPELVERREAPPHSFARHPTIISPVSGGVFEVDSEENATRVADGNATMVTTTHVLVVNCIDPFQCQRYWLRRDSFQVDDRALVPPEFQGWLAGSSPDGRFIIRVIASERSQEVAIWDIVTGDELGLFSSGTFQSTIAFSPDSKFVAGPGQHGSLVVHNLETGETVTFDDIKYSQSIGFIPSQ